MTAILPLYLLSSDGTVLLKDADVETLIGTLDDAGASR